MSHRKDTLPLRRILVAEIAGLLLLMGIGAIVHVGFDSRFWAQWFYGAGAGWALASVFYTWQVSSENLAWADKEVKAARRSQEEILAEIKSRKAP